MALTSTLGCDPPRRLKRSGSRPRPGRVQAAHSSGSSGRYVRSFRSRPDLHPPTIDVVTRAHDTAPGYIFVAPKTGPREHSASQDGWMIVDNGGEPVWFKPLQSEEEALPEGDFKVQRYRGEEVLTFWKGLEGGKGPAEYGILDSSYQEISRVRAGNGYEGDDHEFLITPQGSALFTIYTTVNSFDLSSVGGSKEGGVVAGIVQEVDIETGDVLFEWHSLDHVPPDESYASPSKNPRKRFDYFHINSIEVDHDSNLLVSARNTFTVYKIDRSSGELIWRLGGKKSNFEMGAGTRTRYQHDARRNSDGTISIFDNGGVYKDDKSYGLILDLDMDEMTASLVRRYAQPQGRVSATKGNMQMLPNGNVFIGWGSTPLFSEFSSDGELLFNASFPPGVEFYRAFRFPWSGQPSDDPAMIAERGSDDKVTLYASWNGATEVATWEVLAGPEPEQLKPVGSVPRHGFETAITVGTAERYVGVQAKDSSGRVLGASKATRAI